MGVYVDDIVLIAKTNEQLQDVKTCLAEQVDIKDMGKLCKYGMQDCKLVSTPAESGTKLKSASGTDECVDQRLYQSAVGSLMYLSVTTQPEVTDIVSNLARFSVKPTKDHWNAAKRVIWYLKRTIKLGITYSKQNESPGRLQLTGYSDTNQGGEVNELEVYLQLPFQAK